MENNYQERVAANAINQSLKLKPGQLLEMLKNFGSFSRILKKYRSNKTGGEFEKDYQQLLASGISLLTALDEEYPESLRQIPNAPAGLYYRGDPKTISRPGLAVVGTRKITPYGKQVVLDLIPALSASGLNIVSGMAFGVDAEALQSGMTAGLTPIAVLATPLDDNSLSPKSNYQLAKKIMDQGCIVSEYALKAPVGKQNFLDRNRIISGLSVATLVVEAPIVSGALSTAAFALEQNRTVMAVPASIFSDSSKGCLKLIKNGAAVITSASDIFKELNLDLMERKDAANFNADPLETLILSLIGASGAQTDEIIRSSGLDVKIATQTLTMLEIKGRIRNIGNGLYAKLN